MKKMLEEMMAESKPKEMSEKDIQAKKEMLMELLGLADGELKSRSKKGLDEHKAMKVAVMAKDKEGLKEGLEKAEEVLEQMPSEDMEEESEESEELPEMKAESSMMEEKEEMPEMEEDDEEESFFSKKRK